ncbi:MAG: YggT family protein [Methylococcales bacterium]|nr:YggT family protein [Methylococcaceae bacterium]HIL41428.1 YggT family protein [Methylococcales bacterium]
MDSTYMTNPVIFLIDTFISLYVLAILLRFLLQWVNADFYNPYIQLLVKITHPPLKHLRRVIPSIGRADTSCILLALIIQISSTYTILMLKGVSLSVTALFLLTVSQLITTLLNIFVFAIFARAILSWFSHGYSNPAATLLQSLTEPLLKICRRMIPAISGIDLSPLVAIIALQLAKMLILPPIEQMIALLG